MKATAEALKLSAVSETDPHKRNLILRRVKAATLLAKAVEAMPKDRPAKVSAPDPWIAREDRNKLRREAIERTRTVREKFNEMRRNAPRVKIVVQSTTPPPGALKPVRELPAAPEKVDPGVKP